MINTNKIVKQLNIKLMYEVIGMYAPICMYVTCSHSYIYNWYYTPI